MEQYLIVAVISSILSALFSGFEAIFIAVSVYDISRFSIPEKKFKQLELLILNKRIFIMIFLFLNTSVNVLFSISVYFIFLSLNLSEIVSGIISVGIITPFLFLFSEVLPKVFFRKYKEKILLLVYPILLPIAFLNKLFPSRHDYSETSFFHILQVLQKEFDYSEYSLVQEILRNILNSENIKVKNIMKTIDKVDVILINEKVNDVIKNINFSSQYAFVSNGNNIVGYIVISDLFNNISYKVKDIFRKPEYVFSEFAEFSKVLISRFDFRKPIFVVNEFGLVIGVITYLEIYEVIKSFITKEDEPIKGKSFVVDGNDKLSEILFDKNESLYYVLEKEYPWIREVSTVNGIILYLNEVLPKEGDEIRLGSIAFKVLEVSEFMVKKVRVQL
ncbi:MAG: CNNM domain-containing protein [Brevinematia bacterium]